MSKAARVFKLPTPPHAARPRLSTTPMTKEIRCILVSRLADQGSRRKWRRGREPSDREIQRTHGAQSRSHPLYLEGPGVTKRVAQRQRREHARPCNAHSPQGATHYHLGFGNPVKTRRTPSLQALLSLEK